MDIPAFLNHIFLFGNLGRDEIERISAFAGTVRVKKNSMVFQEGEPASAFFIIAHGTLKIFKISPSGNEVSLHVQNAGDIVAEAAIFDNEVYPAYCRALSDSLLIKIPKDAFVGMIKKTPDVALKMLAAYSKRLRRFVSSIEKMSGSDVKQRLAGYLAENAVKEKGKTVVALRINKKELASLLGSVPETVSRALAFFKKEKIITESGKLIIICNPDKLKKYLQNP